MEKEKDRKNKGKNPTVHVVGIKGDILFYSEIKSLFEHFEKAGYVIKFLKKEMGWIIAIEKK